MIKYTRREFIQLSGAGVITASAMCTNAALSTSLSDYEMIITKNETPGVLVRQAVNAMGGMEKYVKKGQVVLLKPNIGWDRTPEQAANTNPEAVAMVVKMCFEAGAKKVKIVDRTCNEPKRCYLHSGIEAAAKNAGAEVRHIIDSRFVSVEIPDGELIKSWKYYKDIIDCDVFINMPIAKDHGISGYTLGMKNIMGLLGGDRGLVHKNFHTNIVDLNLPLKPLLTIIDAYRVLVRNGPTGGNPDDVVEKRMVIVSTDRVAADAYAVRVMGGDPAQIPYLDNAYKRGLGKLDLNTVHFKEIDLA